jgi:DNA mismatch repair ATPase MutL
VGRSDNDRQFTYCNGRPVDLPKVIKVVNEVWRKVSNVFCVMLCVRVCVYVCRVGVYA